MKMVQRKEDSFFGYHTKQIMNKEVPGFRSKQQQDFLKFYDSVIAYTNKWFDFSTANVAVKLKPIGLYEDLSLNDLETVTAALKMAEIINMDQLYEEFCCSKK